MVVTETPAVTTAQAAMILGMSEAAIRQLAQRGKLTRLGSRNRQRCYPLNEVQALKATRLNETVPNTTNEHYDA